MSQVRQVHCLRAPGSAIYRTTAAIPDRNPATCQLEREHALIAAPPVENKSAAANKNSRFFAAFDNLQSNETGAATI